MKINKRQIKIKSHPDCLFNDSKIVNVKDFDSSLLETTKLSKVFLALIFTTLKTSSYLCSYFGGDSSQMHFLGSNVKVYPYSKILFFE